MGGKKAVRHLVSGNAHPSAGRRRFAARPPTSYIHHRAGVIGNGAARMQSGSIRIRKINIPKSTLFIYSQNSHIAFLMT